MPAPQTAIVKDTAGQEQAAPLNRAAPAAEYGGMRLDFVGSLKRHKLSAALLFLVVALLGTAIAYVKGAPKYSTAAVIYVSPRFVANLEDNKEFDLQSNTQYREYVQQNVRSINRFDIMEDALNRMGTLKGVWVEKGETISRAAERLQSALAIEPVPDTYQITVGLQSPKREGLADIVNAVVTTYISKIKSEEFYGSEERVRNLKTERDHLVSAIAAAQKERSSLAEKLGVSTFSDAFANPYDQLLVDSKTALAEARRQKIQAAAQVDALNSTPAGETASSLRAYALEMTNKDPGLTTLDANLNERRSALLSTLSGLSPEHPGRRAAEKELKSLQEERDAMFHQLLDSYSGMILEQKEGDLAKAQKTENGLQAEVDTQTTKASSFSQGYQHAIALGLQVDRQRKRLDSIEDRISYLSLESKAPGFVRLFSAARAPDMPVKGGRKKIAMIGLLVACVLAAALPVAIDYLDPRVHWPGDLERALGIPVLGWLPEKKQAKPEFDREQMLRLANRINRDFEMNRSRVFVFTGVASGSGTTKVVQRAALALTRLGKPALAVEANAYRADPSYRHPNSRGLTVLLRGQSNLASEIVSGDELSPDSLPVGDIHAFENLPDLHNLLEILREAAKVYSLVLVDVPPLLLSADAELIVGLADVAVLVVEAGSATKQEVRRAARLLERGRPPAVGTILNRVSIDAAASFGRQAQEEFFNGAVRRSPRWLTPWLWK